MMTMDITEDKDFTAPLIYFLTIEIIKLINCYSSYVVAITGMLPASLRINIVITFSLPLTHSLSRWMSCVTDIVASFHQDYGYILYIIIVTLCNWQWCSLMSYRTSMPVTAES